MLTEEMLKEIEARAKAATKGPWIWGDNSYGERRLFGAESTPVLSVDTRSHGYSGCQVDVSPWSEADEKFLTEARADVPALVAEVRKLKTLLSLMVSCDEGGEGRGYPDCRMCAGHLATALEALK